MNTLDNELNLNGFYRGVVENNNDPTFQNKCQIRIFGLHTPDITKLSSSDLPWAEQAGSIFSGSVQGVGVNSVPLNGSWVWVFFEMGDISKPVYFATSVGGDYASSPLETEGFRDSNLYNTDPNVVYRYPRSDRIGGSNDNDVNRLCKAKTLSSTAHEIINFNVMSADGISEPSSASDNTIYPYNNVIETQAGHVLEFDDTKGNERIRLFHKSGSYEEVRPNGDRTLRTNGKYIICTVEDLNEIVAQSVQRYIGSNLIEHIKGNVELVVDGNLSWKVNGEIRFSAGDGILYKGDTIQLNPTFGFAEPALVNSGITYAQKLIEISLPSVSAEDSNGNTIINSAGPEITGGETEELQPVESPVTEGSCTNPWLVAYASYSSIGESGWKENGSNKNILSLWEEIGMPKSSDRTAWCACFLSATLKRAKCKYKPTPSSQAYATYGQEVTGWGGSKANWDANVRKGDILVFSHGGGSGHVGFYNGDSSRYPKVGVLGGNQSDTLKTLYFECNKTVTPMKLIAVRRALCEDGSACSAV